VLKAGYADGGYDVYGYGYYPPRPRVGIWFGF